MTFNMLTEIDGKASRFHATYCNLVNVFCVLVIIANFYLFVYSLCWHRNTWLVKYPFSLCILFCRLPNY